MRRRQFITLVGGAATLAMPGIVGAQQGERVRRVAVLMGWDENDPQAKPLLTRGDEVIE